MGHGPLEMEGTPHRKCVVLINFALPSEMKGSLLVMVGPPQSLGFFIDVALP